jgi:hypothetical protein
MNRQDFTEGSVEQILFDFWDETISGQSRDELLRQKTQGDLIDFITTAHNKGRFGGGYIHD